MSFPLVRDFHLNVEHTDLGSRSSLQPETSTPISRRVLSEQIASLTRSPLRIW